MVYFDDNELWLMHYEWYACDESGKIALFDTCGSNAIPPGMTKVTFSILAQFLRNLKSRCSLVEHNGKLSSCLTDYADQVREQAQVGFYFYNHKDGEYGHSYQLLLSPTKPLFVRELPELIQNLFLPPLVDSFDRHPDIADSHIFGGEKRLVPLPSDAERVAEQIRGDSLWRQFFELLQVAVRKHHKVQHYIADWNPFLHFCPQCLEQRGHYVELDGCYQPSNEKSGNNHFNWQWMCDYCDYEAHAPQSSFCSTTSRSQDIVSHALDIAIKLAREKAKEK